MPNVASGYIGSKVKISFWDVSLSPDGYTRYTQVSNFGDIGEDTPEIDKTTLDSDAVERMPGLSDPSKLDMMLNMDLAGYTLILAQKNARAALDLKVDFTDAGFALIVYFKWIPLGVSIVKIDAKKLLELKYSGRMTGAISVTDPHA